jgi:hypothetical protein
MSHLTGFKAGCSGRGNLRRPFAEVSKMGIVLPPFPLFSPVDR